jgi:hypothetical protein
MASPKIYDSRLPIENRKTAIYDDNQSKERNRITALVARSLSAITLLSSKSYFISTLAPASSS